MNPLNNKKALSTILVVAIVVLVVAVAVVSVVAYIWLLPSNPKTQTFNFKNFTAIEVGSAFKVEITKSNTYNVEITANERLFDNVEVTQIGNTLKINVKPGSIFGNFNGDAKIALPILDKVTLSGATHGTAEGFNSSNLFVAEISGASSLQMTNFQLQDVTFEVSGASGLTATGTAHNLDATISGASTTDLSSFTVNDANLNLSGASNAQIDLNGRLDAELSGASNLQYSGSPTLGNINTTGASTITKK